MKQEIEINYFNVINIRTSGKKKKNMDLHLFCSTLNWFDISKTKDYYLHSNQKPNNIIRINLVLKYTIDLLAIQLERVVFCYQYFSFHCLFISQLVFSLPFIDDKIACTQLITALKVCEL